MTIFSPFLWATADVKAQSGMDLGVTKISAGETLCQWRYCEDKESTRRATPIVIRCRCGGWEDRYVVQSGLEVTAVTFEGAANDVGLVKLSGKSADRKLLQNRKWT
jgi:hypothetical protein